ncbi:MAG: hypothetical protein HQK65_09450 [Desulfamplus sp.]|nr:hypothetical protein [Desulfamplus sp.]
MIRKEASGQKIISVKKNAAGEKIDRPAAKKYLYLVVRELQSNNNCG